MALASNKPADIGEYQASFICITVPCVLLTYSGVFSGGYSVDPARLRRIRSLVLRGGAGGDGGAGPSGAPGGEGGRGGNAATCGLEHTGGRKRWSRWKRRKRRQ